MNLPKIHSITKKICVALLGSFLLIFLLFHACANLCVLRHDDGAWYSAFCHFMGTNWIVKCFEVVLIGSILLHILLTLWLWFTNRIARGSERYHQPSKTKTHTGSKLMIWTGILILVLLIVHFCDFYFVKLGFVKGQYMVKVEELQDNRDVAQLAQACNQYQCTPEDFIATNEQQLEQFKDQLEPAQIEEFNQQMAKFREIAPIVNMINDPTKVAENHKYFKNLSKEERDAINATFGKGTAEPDFYSMAREKFHNPIMVIIYLIFFVVVWFHLRHAFASAFQTLGLNNYKYNRAIEMIAQIYAWTVCLIFAAVAILVFLGF
ncbi:MAG: hypothetical protein MJZ67_03040 [Bacteroidales bacterium]|nr:hypothetical protein [Bacteroidales bacterium]